MPTPQQNATLPSVQERRWRKKMESQRKKVATPSLKQRRMKTLWRRLERTRRGRMYGGTYAALARYPMD